VGFTSPAPDRNRAQFVFDFIVEDLRLALAGFTI